MAVLGRSYLVMQDGFERILARLPFTVRQIHPDNSNSCLLCAMLPTLAACVRKSTLYSTSYLLCPVPPMVALRTFTRLCSTHQLLRKERTPR